MERLAGLTPEEWAKQLRAREAERAGHRGVVPFPAGRYPVTLAEVCGQVELQARMIETMAKRVHALELQLAALDRWCAAADRWREAGADK